MQRNLPNGKYFGSSALFCGCLCDLGDAQSSAAAQNNPQVQTQPFVNKLWEILLWRKQRWEILLGDIRGQQGPEANNLSLESGNTHSSPIEDGQLQRRGNCRHLF